MEQVRYGQTKHTTTIGWDSRYQAHLVALCVLKSSHSQPFVFNKICSVAFPGKNSLAVGDNHEEILRLDGFRPLFNGQESAACVRLRRLAFKSAHSRFRSRVNQIIALANRQRFKEIGEFVMQKGGGPLERTNKRTKLHSSTTILSDESSKVTDMAMYASSAYLPVALVFAGINTPDHVTIFDELLRTLAVRRHRVTALHSSECGSIKTMMQAMISGIVNAPIRFDDEEEEEETFTLLPRKRKGGLKYARHDIRIVHEWYSSWKQDHRDSKLVVLLRDFESMDPRVLERFIAICHEWTDTLPIVLLFAVATSSDAVSNMLSEHALSLLALEKFVLHESDAIVDDVIEQLLVHADSFHTFEVIPGFGPFKLLIDNFANHHLSIEGFSRSCEFVLMEHFYSNPLSILCAFARRNSNTFDSRFRSFLCENHLQAIRMLTSFKRHIESLVSTNPELGLRLMEDDAYLVDSVPGFLDDIKNSRTRCRLAIDCLSVLQEMANVPPSMRRSRRILYQLYLEDSLASSEFLGQWLRILKSMRLEDIRKFLEICVATFEREDDDDEKKSLFESEIARVLSLQDEANRLQEKAKSAEKANLGITVDACVGAAAIDGDPLETPMPRRTATSMRSWRDASKGTWIQWRDDVMDVIGAFFNDALRSCRNRPLYEVMYFVGPAVMRNAFNPQPRAAVQTALAAQHHYLSCTCCAEIDGLSPTLCDAAILYRLYCECGRLINLHDLMVSFGDVLGAGENPPSTEERQNRFLRAAAELQLMGFIKPTNRKTDHVMRLTWGSTV